MSYNAHTYRSMIEYMPINVMTCDLKNFKIDYLNRKSLETLKTIEHALPCRADQMLGTCIDIFHKNPAHQRQMLKDPKNLPHSAVISIGGEYLDLHITPITDKSGRYIAPMVTWSVITDKVEHERQNLVQAQMLDQMPINTILCNIETFEITYANQATKDTLKSIEHLLPIKAKDLIGANIDVFHKNPAHQRNLLKDPSNLPHSTRIRLGDQFLNLNVSALYDKSGHYFAALLTWSVVTAQVRLADQFEADVKTVVDGVSSASTEMQATSETMASGAEETSVQANTVASAAEELSRSITEIGQQVAVAARVSNEAVENSKKSKHDIQTLTDSADKIGDVMQLINDIANQTNLLALNATIEAARAGEAGKGFAVVANEVKSLANQTAKATEEIDTQVRTMQSATHRAIAVMETFTASINQISEISAAISAAVEKQHAATSEVSSNIDGVGQASRETGEAASETLKAASELSQQAALLSRSVDSFLEEIRKL
ncbi:methyl-accepting chemotaxis protein [Rhodospirillaceae bacterium KN72]|uniref:Methyl-accepting chemotaxis protein n=1 Tax=Pacificispira spongiicola TaxID=2729598 RepID=A0A7Y0HFZ1_9PROT|nr:methyl-accepting chemotaxis protein [Pacificispira spongiicola]NMM46370.1 methyl-accepting chemotaxis protein [Pacificispira spongiicola]